MSAVLRLGVNIDHVATIRNARGGGHPDPVRAARLAARAGADSIVAHLREDRRHISDDDLARLMGALDLPLTLEMAATDEMLEIALRHCPHAVCIVPERRQERTTEGGLDVAGSTDQLGRFVDALGAHDIQVSMFIEADPRQLDATHALGAPAIEIHTGAYCDAAIAGDDAARTAELARIGEAARYGDALGLEVHAGHGLTFSTVTSIAAMPEIVELNIGHFLIGEAIYSGLDSAIKRMRSTMDGARRTDCVTGDSPHQAMMILGIGSDLIDTRRIERTLERFGERFTTRCFTAVERAKSDRRARRAESYAKRYAAKEACSKALGTGFRHGVYWRDLGVVNLPSGKPTLELTGGAARRLVELTPDGMKAVIELTLTDEPPLAQAIVIITAVPADQPVAG